MITLAQLVRPGFAVIGHVPQPFVYLITNRKGRVGARARSSVGDLEQSGDPLVPNGLSLCSIHHRAYDQDLIGVSPDYEVRVSRRLLDKKDGPMLELLKEFHARPIDVPTRRAWRPDRERLATRFERFTAAG